MLAAYSMHNEAVGYCRCMNHIAALLLLALNRCGLSGSSLQGAGAACMLGGCAQLVVSACCLLAPSRQQE